MSISTFVPVSMSPQNPAIPHNNGYRKNLRHLTTNISQQDRLYSTSQSMSPLLSEQENKAIIQASHDYEHKNHQVKVGLAVAVIVSVLASGGVAVYGLLRYLKERKAYATLRDKLS